MDFQIVFYIIAGIIYLLYNGNKGLKKFRENQPTQGPPAKSWEEELEELLRDKLPKNKPEPVKTPEKKPVVVKEVKVKPVPVVENLEEEYRIQREKEKAAYVKEGSDSIEFNETFVHADLGIGEKPAETRIPDEAVVSYESFDARKAFIYSEIFNRKY